MKIAEYNRLNDLFEESFEIGDIAVAHEACQSIIALIADGAMPQSLLPYHKYELGIINAFLESNEDAVSELEEVILLLKTSRRQDHIWLVNESRNAISLLEEFTDADQYQDVLWDQEHYPISETNIA